jgi:hypothetical protein
MDFRSNNPMKKIWSIDVDIDEHDNYTRARARLDLAGERLVGVGFARLDPSDDDVPAIGDELAVSRALSDLGNVLLRRTSKDIEAVTHEHAHLTH